MPSEYAWRIDKDHLADGENDPHTCAGVTGPRDAGEFGTYPNHNQFRMYDDDGELYVTGTLFWQGTGPEEPSENALYGPLRDYGGPALGCVRIDYTGRPDWSIG